MNTCTVPWKNAAKSNSDGQVASCVTVLDVAKIATELDMSLLSTQTDFRLTNIATLATVRDSVKFAAEEAVIILAK